MAKKKFLTMSYRRPDAASIAPTPLKTTEDKYLRASLFRVYEGNTPITAKEYENKMRTNPTAYNEYQAARSLSITGSIFSAVGGIFSLITLLNEEMLPSARKNANIMSWSGFGLGLALSFVAESKGRKAIDIYNNTQKLSTRLKINSNENGIGLALRF